jgi:hypothetical protein
MDNHSGPSELPVLPRNQSYSEIFLILVLRADLPTNYVVTRERNGVGVESLRGTGGAGRRAGWTGADTGAVGKFGTKLPRFVRLGPPLTREPDVFQRTPLLVRGPWLGNDYSPNAR